MKFLLTTLLILVSFSHIYAQEDSTKVDFIAYWHLGDSFDFRITKLKEKIESGQLVKTDSSSYIANFEVIDSTAKSYKIKWRCKANLFQDMGVPAELMEVMSKHELKEVIYTTDEYGAFEGIENWEAISKTFKSLMEEIMDLETPSKTISKEDIKKAMTPMSNMFTSKFGIEQLVFKEISFFHYPLGSRFSDTDTLKYNDLFPNSYGGDPIRAEVAVHMEYVDRKEGMCALIQELKLNEQDAKNVLADYYKSMGVKQKEYKKMLKKSNYAINDINRYEYFYYPGLPYYIETVRSSLIEINGDKSGGIEKITIEILK